MSLRNLPIIRAFFGSKSPKTQLLENPEHINRELYKKSVELTEQNKTLSLLQKLNELSLRSINHLSETAQLITSLLVTETNFELVAIFFYNKNKNVLQRIGFSETPKNIQIPYASEISLVQTENLLVKAVTERMNQTKRSFENILLSSSESNNPDIFKAVEKSNTVYVFPLIARNEVLGTLIVALPEKRENITEYQTDLLDRLVSTIGIAVDNAVLYDSVQIANKRLQELDKQKDEFVSLASHELRTPMTAVKSYLSFLLDEKLSGSLSPSQKESLKKANMAIDRLISLVFEMLDISRIESGKLTINTKPLDIIPVITEVKEEVQPRIDELGLTLTIENKESLPAVLADNNKIKQVLINLIGNAMKFTPKGGKIMVTFVKNGNYIETSVTDTGCGIDAKDLPKLFQKFNILVDSYKEDQPQGTGLGLYLSKAILKLHGGDIWAASSGIGKGSYFTFSLPIAG